MALSETQLKCLVIAPKITAGLSIFGTTYVIRHVLSSKKKRKLVYHRILVCISGIDLIIGICMFLARGPFQKIPTVSLVPLGRLVLVLPKDSFCSLQSWFPYIMQHCPCIIYS